MAKNAINELQNLSVRVHKGLESYISVHNRIHNESGTFMSLFKNMLGRGGKQRRTLEIFRRFEASLA
jgi:hypothetical protein